MSLFVAFFYGTIITIVFMIVFCKYIAPFFDRLNNYLEGFDKTENNRKEK